ncbi:MAG: hypothetical protein ACRDPC_12305 [Solirubrobacteraceae bacterium]
MKRLSVLVTAAVAAIGVAVALAATGSAQQPGEQTVKLIERPLTGHVVDNPPKGTRRTSPLFSPGDLTVQTSALFDEANTTRLGTLHSECIATRGGTRARATFHCTGMFKLKAGTLAFDFAGKSAETITLAITGGTGAFEGRDGSDLSTEKRDVIEHTIRLRP